MNTEHTPGPWWRDDDGFIASGSGDTYLTVASPNCSNDIDIDEREANANLIAAAPCLLTALQDMLALYDDILSSNGLGNLCLQDYERLNLAPLAARKAVESAQPSS